MIDGVFALGEDGQVHFAEAAALTPEDLAAVQQQVRTRVLRWFARAGHLDPADARDMAGWHHGGGFSLDASVRIEGADRAGLERLLRYCARPPFALERLEQLGHDQLVYRLPKPQPDGRTELRLSPLELLERLAALIPPPRLHRHRYHEVLAPNPPWRVRAVHRGQIPPVLWRVCHEQGQARQSVPSLMAAFWHRIWLSQCRKVAGSCRWRSPIADIPVRVCFRDQRQAVVDPKRK